jgi:pyruvate/2-oxoglutarate dehydrogenase complex dihydrolipoamide dehydrogenase (E3) component
VIATGADPVLPSLAGTDLPGVRLLHQMDQAFELDRALRERQAGSVLIIGAGYIGLEMAEAFSHRGLAVTVVEQRWTSTPAPRCAGSRPTGTGCAS